MAGTGKQAVDREGKTRRGPRDPRKRKTSRSGAKPAADDVQPTDAAADATAREALRESDKLYYRIGEVSRLTGVKAHVLRYWETEFRWMAPPKSRSKQRLYRKRDIEFVWLLKRLLWEERYTIAGARQRIQDLGVDGALALLDGASATDAAQSGSVGSAAARRTDHDTAAASRRVSSVEWLAFRGALDEMQKELVSLRGVLLDGA